MSRPLSPTPVASTATAPSGPAKPSASPTYSGVVIYDAGSHSREALTFGFEREDFEVLSTDRAEEALQLLEVSKAPILAVSIGTGSSERAEALSFVGTLRDAVKRPVAVVVLGRRDLREDALRAGADEFVAWPAFIRDAVTLARLAVAARADHGGAGLSGLLEDYEVYFLVRALAAAGRSALIEVERAGHKAQLHFARGELVAARVGRLSGIAAFHHLLLWAEATLKLRFVSPPGERKIHAPIDDLLQSGVRFVEEFEKLAKRVGGPQATFEKRPERFADPTLKVPPEVRRFAETVVSGATLVDLVEASPFKPFDTIKVCYRLCDLGLVARRDPVRSISPLTAQLAVRDWLLGTATAPQRSTVTEAGRRAAEAYAEAAAARAKVEPAESDALFNDGPTAKEDATPALVIDEAPSAPREPERGPAARNKRRPSQEQVAVPEAAKLSPAQRASAAEAPKPRSKSAERSAGISAPKASVEKRAAKIAPAAIEQAPVKEPVFDEVDEAFFAKEAELSRVEAAESFDDLDESMRHRKLSPKKKWSLFGEGSPPKPTTPPRKRR